MALIGDMVINLVGRTSGLQRSMSLGRRLVRSFARDAAGDLRKFGRNADSIFARLGRRVKSLMLRLKRLSIAVGTGFVGASMLALRSTMQFDDQIRAVGARTQSTRRGLLRYRDAALDLGRRSSFTAVQVAQMMEAIGRKGLAEKQVMSLTRATMGLARATGADVTVAADLLSASLKVFGKEASEARHVMDVFTAAANKSTITIEDLSEGWGYVSSDAVQLGVTIEELAAAFAVLSNGQIKGARAGTTMRRVLGSMSQAAKMEKIFGPGSFTDAEKNLLPLGDVLQQLAGSMKDVKGNTERAVKVQEMFNIRGTTAVNLLTKSLGEYDRLLAAFRSSRGITDQIVRMMEAGLGGAWRRLVSALQGITIQFGYVLTPAMVRFFDYLAFKINRVTDWIKDGTSDWQWWFTKTWNDIWGKTKWVWNNFGKIADTVLEVVLAKTRVWALEFKAIVKDALGSLSRFIFPEKKGRPLEQVRKLPLRLAKPGEIFDRDVDWSKKARIPGFPLWDLPIPMKPSKKKRGGLFAKVGNNPLASRARDMKGAVTELEKASADLRDLFTKGWGRNRAFDHLLVDSEVVFGKLIKLAKPAATRMGMVFINALRARLVDAKAVFGRLIDPVLKLLPAGDSGVGVIGDLRVAFGELQKTLEDMSKTFPEVLAFIDSPFFEGIEKFIARLLVLDVPRRDFAGAHGAIDYDELLHQRLYGRAKKTPEQMRDEGLKPMDLQKAGKMATSLGALTRGSQGAMTAIFRAKAQDEMVKLQKKEVVLIEQLVAHAKAVAEGMKPIVVQAQAPVAGE